jgi:4-amino-4-deoxy-L-arabinose transferase-like glycosyltransferase
MMPRSREATAILIFFAGAALFSVGAASVGWSHALSDSYGWTQTETAIRVHFIRQGGPWLDYETPVLGPPWRMPHELPVYHLLVAALAAATALGIEPAGRVVSLGFFYAALSAAYALLGELGVASRHRMLMLALCLLSPLYVFWSRTLTVEPAALCLSLAFLALAARFLERERWPDAVGAVVAGALAFAVKPPTMAAFATLAGLWWLVVQRRRGYRLDSRLILGALVVLAPVAVGWSWHGHTDAVKRLNPFAWAAFSSDAMVRDWVLGPDGLRSDPAIWRVLWDRTLPDTVGHAAIVIAAAVGVVLAGRRRALFLLALVVPVAHFAVFTPLHLSHAYDQYAVGLFVPLAAGLAAVALLERGGARRYLAWALVLLVATGSIEGWRERMLPVQRRDAYRRPAWFVRLARTLADATQPSDVILGFGMSANPEVAYYARRRALMWPDWADASPDGEDVASALEALEGHRVGALFSCPRGAPEATLERFRAQAGLDAVPLELPSGGRGSCLVHLKSSEPPSRE